MLQRRRQRGQSLVEFALVLPLLLVILLGIIEAGWVFHHWLILSGATREGARYGIIHPDAESVRARVRELTGFSDRDQVFVDVAIVPEPEEGEDLSGRTLTVVSSYSHQLLTGFFRPLFGAPGMKLVARAVMRVE